MFSTTRIITIISFFLLIFLIYTLVKEINPDISSDVEDLPSRASLKLDELDKKIAEEIKVLNRTLLEDSNISEASTDLFKRRYGLDTDTSKTSIELDLVLSGGPGKDGIPAINNPKFTTIQESDVAKDVRGILVNIGDVQRFYPYSILVWHEIVNDRIDETFFSVTFCPLCDSGIVFDREIDDEILQFGVSGLLFESNLLMYDTKTESLWSQSKLESVVGDYLGKKLKILPIQVITLGEVEKKYADAEILSTDTGFRRNYENAPYSGYLEREELVFPVSVSDKRFFSKEPFYVIPFKDSYVSFPYKEFEEGVRVFDVEGEELRIERDGDEIYVSNKGTLLPGYFELWFSFATAHPDDGIVLDL